MYGTTGIMELIQDKLHHKEGEAGGKIELKDLSETNTMMNTSLSEDTYFERSFSTDHMNNKLNNDLEVGFKMMSNDWGVRRASIISRKLSVKQLSNS